MNVYVWRIDLSSIIYVIIYILFIIFIISTDNIDFYCSVDFKFLCFVSTNWQITNSKF